MAAERGEMEEERKRGMRDQGRAEEGLPRKREGRLRAGLAGRGQGDGSPEGSPGLHQAPLRGDGSGEDDGSEISSPPRAGRVGR